MSGGCMSGDQSQGRFDGHDPATGDTAGVPWQGRTLTGTGFDGDDGRSDARLYDALHTGAQESALVAAVANARLIVPIVAVPGESLSSDMAAVTLSAPDGRKALPAFSSTELLASWDSAARPVPVTAQRAALAAVQEGCDVVVLDVGTDHAAELRTSMVWALAMDREWLPSHRDPHVRAAVESAVRAEEHLGAWSLEHGEGGALVIQVELTSGLSAPIIKEVLQRVGAAIATDGEARARIDAVSFRLLGDSGS